jgi:hypothetical protein
MKSEKDGVPRGVSAVALEPNYPLAGGAMHFSIPISAQKLCEHFQKCATSPVEDRLESS